MSVAENLKQIQARINQACLRSGRDPEEIRLLAVSKRKPVADIEAAAAAGQQLFGENYVQELCTKAEAIRLPVIWHFIGALQSNKVKYLRDHVSLIHSVDRLSLAKEIDRQWQRTGHPAKVLLQVNLGDEDTKAGISEEQLPELARAVADLPFLQVEGLMALPPYCPDPEEVRPYFRRLRQLADILEKSGQPNLCMRQLSMGMSHDFEVAIEEGATLVRVGTAIFGERT